MKRSLTLAALVLLPLACGGDTARPQPDPATLRIGNGGEPKSLDPHIVTGIIEERLLSSMFEGLVNLDFETMQPTPGVAESWEISDDGLTYTFHLRDGAKWSNGDPVTADDFVYSWRRILTPALAAEYAYLLYPIENAEDFNNGTLTDVSLVGVTAPDPRTLVVRLRAPTPYFLILQIHFSSYPVHRATLESFGATAQRDTAWTRPGNLVSNGPFTLTAWTPNREIVVTKNVHYWAADEVQLDRIVFRPIQDPSTEERLFRAGELDVTNQLPISRIAEYQQNQPQLLVINPVIATEFIRFNTTREPFDDPRVRLAFAHAIDRDALVNHVMKGGQTPATSFVPPDLGGYQYGSHLPRPPDAPAPRHTFDPQAARDLLAEAGFPRGEGFPGVTLIFDTNDNNRRYCEALQNMWLTHLGVRVQLQNMDGKSWLSSMMSLDYDLARSFWVADYPDPSNFLDMFYATSGNNRTGFADAEYEAHVRSALRIGATTSTDATIRHQTFERAEMRLLEAAPVTPVYFQTRAYVRDERLHGLTPNNLGRIDFRKVSFRP